MANNVHSGSNSTAECKVTTFYNNDVCDEVDQHFAKALSTATTNREPPHPDSSIKATSNTTQSIRGILQQPSIFPSVHPPLLYTANETITSSWNQPLEYSTAASSPPPTTASRGVIVHPEFVNFLVHPEVNSFKDIPKLPGQSDTTSPCLITEGWSSSTSPLHNQRTDIHVQFTDQELQDILGLYEQ